MFLEQPLLCCGCCLKERVIKMREYDRCYGGYRNVRMGRQKSIRIDEDTLNVINSIYGENFSQKIRNLTREYLRIRDAYENLSEKCNTNKIQD